MSTAAQYEIEGVDLSDDEYEVVQSLIRNKYKAVDKDGNTILRAKQKLFKLKEEFPFVDENDNEVFTVKASGMLDIAGNYVLQDTTGKDVVVLDNDFSIFQDTWRIRDADSGKLLGQIDSRGALVTLARTYLPFGGLIPHKYEISDSDGSHVGNIDGQISIKDRYEISIDDASQVPKEPIVAAAMVIDAIQGN